MFLDCGSDIHFGIDGQLDDAQGSSRQLTLFFEEIISMAPNLMYVFAIAKLLAYSHFCPASFAVLDNTAALYESVGDGWMDGWMDGRYIHELFKMSEILQQLREKHLHR